MPLAEQQQAFWRAVRTRGAPPDGLDDLFVARPTQSAADRLGVYHRAYWQRQVSALTDTFKRCGALLGARELERLLLAYIEAAPSREPCIERSAAGFADFLATRSPTTPVVCGLARLEWAALEALLAFDPEGVVKFPDVSGRAFAASRLTFVPSLRVVRVPRASWDHLEGDDRSEVVARSDLVSAAVWRPRFGVRRQRLDHDEAQALELARGGADIAGTCEAFSAFSHADVVPRARQVLSSWFAREWISRCDAGESALARWM